MKVRTGLQALARPPRRAVVAIGMFDGVHIGHQRLIRAAVRMARNLKGTSVIMTFHPDPQRILAPSRVQPSLMPLDVRVRLIGELGPDLLWIIPFTKRFASLSAEQFVRGILAKRLRASTVIVGRTFNFGRGREGTLTSLQAMGRRLGMRVAIVPSVRRGGASVSSSRIRTLIQQGRVEDARRLLGRPVQLHGTVVRGANRGHRLGIPTANVRLVNELPPPQGVYVVRLDHGAGPMRGVMNLGVRPTFGPGPVVCEVHLAGRHPRLYGRRVTIGVLRRLRGERKFPTSQALIAQIRRDLRRAGFYVSERIV